MDANASGQSKQEWVARVFLRFLDPLWAATSMLVVLAGTLVVQLVGYESAVEVAPDVQVVRPNGFLWSAVLGINIASAWLLLLLVIRAVRADLPPEGESIRAFSSHMDLNAPLLEVIRAHPRCEVTLVCQGGEGFNQLVFHDRMDLASSLTVYLSHPSVAPASRRDGIRRTIRALENRSNATVHTLLGPPLSRAALIVSEEGLPVWLSISAYTSTAEGHGRPTLAFSDFSTQASQEFLGYFKREVTRLRQRDWQR